MNEEEAREILKDITTIDFYNYYSEYTFPEKEVQEKCKAIETVLNLLEKKDIDIIEAKEANRQLSVELQKKDKIIDEIQKEVRDHIGFENRLKRDNKEPDLFNQGRFYVANNINNILKGK